MFLWVACVNRGSRERRHEAVLYLSSTDTEKSQKHCQAYHFDSEGQDLGRSRPWKVTGNSDGHPLECREQIKFEACVEHSKYASLLQILLTVTLDFAAFGFLCAFQASGNSKNS